MADYAGNSVAEILKTKKARILKAPLDPGFPSWDDIMHLTWEKSKKNIVAANLVSRPFTSC